MKKNNLILLVMGISFMLLSCAKDNLVPCFTTTKSAFDVDEAIAFTNCTKNAEKYLWQFGDGTTSEEASPTHTFKSKGTYNVSLAIVSPGSLQQSLVYTNTIAISNQSAKFLNLNNGQVVVTETGPNGFKGADTTTIDTSDMASFNFVGFDENSKKVIWSINPFGSTNLKFSEDVTNNQITAADKSDVAGGVTYKVSGFVAKYEASKVTIEYTTTRIAGKTTTRKYNYTFLK